MNTTKRNTTFKLVFGEDDIRRITLPVASWDSFNEQLLSLYPDLYHPELTVRYRDEEEDLITISTEKEWDCMLESFPGDQPIRLYISEGKNAGKYFKDGPPPVTQAIYNTTPENNERITLCGGDSLKKLEIEVPKCLSRLFPGGKILPYNIPTWLQGCVQLKKVPGPDPVVDLDIDVAGLFDSLHEQSVSMIGPEKEAAVLTKAKEFLQSMLDIVPNHPVANYNLACAQSLLGEVKEALESLRRAIVSGYNNTRHMLQDPDLENLRSRMSSEFQRLIALATGEIEATETKEEPVVMEEPEEKKPEEVKEIKVEVTVVEVPEKVIEPPKVEEVKEEPKLVEPESKPEEKKEEVKFEGKWAKQHEALAAMGFSNFDVNAAMLDHYKGDLVKVVNALLSQ